MCLFQKDSFNLGDLFKFNFHGTFSVHMYFFKVRFIRKVMHVPSILIP